MRRQQSISSRNCWNGSHSPSHALHPSFLTLRKHRMLQKTLNKNFPFNLALLNFRESINASQLCSHCGWLLLKCSAIGIGFNGAETNYCRIAHILGILLMNSCNTDKFLATILSFAVCPLRIGRLMTIKNGSISRNIRRCPAPPKCLADPSAVDRAICVLREARKPLVIIGKGIYKKNILL